MQSPIRSKRDHPMDRILRCSFSLLPFLILPFLALLNTIFLPGKVLAQSKEEINFLTPAVREAISISTRVHASLIMTEEESARRRAVDRQSGKYIQSPMRMDFVPSLGGTDIFLNETQISTLKSYLLKAAPIDLSARIKTCVFQPGINFRFYQDQYMDDSGTLMMFPSTTVLLCLNCDAWAVTSQSNVIPEALSAHDSGISYGDSRPFRAELLAMKTQLFKALK